MRDDPLLIGALGGSGTRVVARVARAGGVFMGTHLNESQDSEPLQAFYNQWLRRCLQANGSQTPHEVGSVDRAFRDALIAHLGGADRGTTPWGVKVPRSILMLEFWRQWFPNLKFVHVVRNGLDMAYSQDRNQLHLLGDLVLSASELSAEPPMRAMAYWCHVNTVAADFGERHPHCYLRIRFEDLCENPADVIGELMAFIGKPTLASCLTDAVGMVEPPASLGRWRDGPDDEVDRLARMGRAVLTRFDYASPPSRSSCSRRAG